jgi:DNA adenine methylase
MTAALACAWRADAGPRRAALPAWRLSYTGRLMSAGGCPVAIEDIAQADDAAATDVSFLKAAKRRGGRAVDPLVRTPGRKTIAFGWYGGKYSHLDWLLPLLPPAHHYCEPFGGSAAVLLNRPPAPVETYNDLDGEVVNFFRVLRDQKEALVEAIGLTPFAREEFSLAVSLDDSPSTDLERARRFFVRARQARTGLAQTATLGRWANCKNTSRRGMSGVVSRWLGSIEGLPEVALRLLRVQIENRAALDVIRLYDDRATLVYCDPPYPHDSRGDSHAYGFEMSDMAHRELADVLHACKGRVAISGYRCALMDELYGGWRRADAPAKLCHSVKTERQEALWMNYDADSHRLPAGERPAQRRLFERPAGFGEQR